MSSKRRPYDVIKRGIDIVGAGTGLVLLSPVIVGTALLVRAKHGSPVLFKQKRPGRNGEIFYLYKFRSMLNVDEGKEQMTNEQRLTTFGRWLRSTSLDELPSLVNVLKGDMSIVGPRPLRVDYLSRYTTEQARRHEVRPGITGLAQIRGRNNLSWERRFELDVQYIEQHSALFDLRIMIQTLLTVFKKEGIAADGMASMSAFVGSRPDDGLEELPLDENWLETRVAWLQHPSIREGITISFDPNLASTIDWFDSIRSSPDRRDWVYTDEAGSPVAMAGLSGVGRTEFELYLYIHPEKHSRGYGSSVIRRLILNSRSFGADKLSLEVKESNKNAIKLYQKMGFIVSANHSKDGIAKRRYSLNLKDVQ